MPRSYYSEGTEVAHELVPITEFKAPWAGVNT